MFGAKTADGHWLRRFRKDKRGATAVEFALVAVPFLGLLGSIVETGLTFIAAQALDRAAYAAGRKVMTGEAKTSGDFQTALCANASWLISCSSIKFDVKSYKTFGTADMSVPMSGGDLNTAGMGYNRGGGGDIVVVRAYYKRAVYADRLGSNLGNIAGGYRILVGTSVFRNEP